MSTFKRMPHLRADRHPELITADKLAATPVPLVQLMQEHIDAGRATEQQLAAQLGFTGDAPLRQMLSGAMKVPLSLVPALSKALGIDEIALACLWMRENDPRLHDYFNRMRELTNLSPGEVTLIEQIRTLTLGRGVIPVMFDKGPVVALLEC